MKVPQPAEELTVVVEEPVEEKPIVGGPKTITCADGTNVVCASGTRDCFDGSEFFCGTPEPEPTVVGGEQTITCDDGTKIVCAAGTADCFDGSEALCGVQELSVEVVEQEVGEPTTDRVFGAPNDPNVYYPEEAPNQPEP